MLLSLVNIVVFVIAIVCIIAVYSKRRNVAFYCLALFDMAYVFPIFIEEIMGKARVAASYSGFVLSSNDETTSFIYAIFIIIVELFFVVYLKTSKSTGPNISNVVHLFQKKWGQNPLIIFISIIFSLSSIIAIALAPNPDLYLSNLGAFAVEHPDVSLFDIVYHKKIVAKVVIIAILGITTLKVIDKNNLFSFKVIRIAGIIFVALANGKRTLVTFLIIVLFLVDFLMKKSRNYIRFNAIAASACVLIYFIVYSYISGKYEYNTDWYSVLSEYFFRSNSVKVSIYSILNPDKLPIIDYPGQTLLFNFFFFIPRSIWPNKPYPFPDYYTSAIFGFDKLTSIGWNFQTNIYCEWIANLGFVAFALVPFLLITGSRIINRSKGVLEYIIGISFLMLIQVFEYSDLLKIVFFLWMIMIAKRNMRFKMRKRIDHE